MSFAVYVYISVGCIPRSGKLNHTECVCLALEGVASFPVGQEFGSSLAGYGQNASMGHSHLRA